MLLADNKEFVVPTATKTGTFSLESVLTKNGFGQIMPRHRTRVPDGWHKARVIFMIRNPYARLVSAFRYGIVKKHSWLLRSAGPTQDFEVFCRNWANAFDDGKAKDWTTTLTEYVEDAERTNPNSVTLVRLEDDGVHGLLKVVGLGHLPDKNINKSHDRFEEKWNHLWTPNALAAVGDRLKEDLSLCNYKRPRSSR